MDETDRKILTVLQQDADLSAAQVAEKVGLSATPCWRRIRKLEADGIIAGRAVLLNAKALGLTVNVYADIRLRQHDEDTLLAFEAAIARLPQIVECFSVSGESDYIVRIITDSIETYEWLLKKMLLHMPGVASVNSRFALGCVKMTTALPL